MKLSKFALDEIGKIMSFSAAEDINGRINYILIPYRRLLACLYKLSWILFLTALISVNGILSAMLLPVYIILFYYYYLLWDQVKEYGFKLPPCLVCVFAANIPIIAAAVITRSIIGAVLN